MGTDIHVFIEKKTDEGWKQVQVEDWLIPEDRNYMLFGYLSSIRYHNFNKEMLEKNWPTDASVSTELDYHNLGHIYLFEINQYWNWPVSLEYCYFRIFCRDILPRIPELQNVPPRDVRLLIAYDN